MASQGVSDALVRQESAAPATSGRLVVAANHLGGAVRVPPRPAPDPERQPLLEQLDAVLAVEHALGGGLGGGLTSPAVAADGAETPAARPSWWATPMPRSSFAAVEGVEGDGTTLLVLEGHRESETVRDALVAGPLRSAHAQRLIFHLNALRSPRQAKLRKARFNTSNVVRLLYAGEVAKVGAALQALPEEACDLAGVLKALLGGAHAFSSFDITRALVYGCGAAGSVLDDAIEDVLAGDEC